MPSFTGNRLNLRIGPVTLYADGLFAIAVVAVLAALICLLFFLL